MKKQKKTEKEHFVPQAYLKHFAKGKLIWVFDKLGQKVFEQSISEVAQGRHFYDLPEEFAQYGINPQIAENRFQIAERDLDEVLREILPRIGYLPISSREKEKLAFHVAFQWVRTAEFRATITEIERIRLQAIADRLIEKNFPDMPRRHYPRVKIRDEAESAKHFLAIFDGKMIPALIDIFLERYFWFWGVNNSEQSLYTSDNPVVLQSHSEHAIGLGAGTEGSEFVFPLSPRCALLLKEKSHFSLWQPHNGASISLSEREVERLNKLQILQSSRQIFCQEDQFDLARRVCEEFSEIAAKRPRNNFTVSIIPSTEKPDTDIILTRRK